MSTQDGYVGRDGSDDDGATGGYIRQVKFDGLEMLVCGGPAFAETKADGAVPSSAHSHCECSDDSTAAVVGGVVCAGAGAVTCADAAAVVDAVAAALVGDVDGVDGADGADGVVGLVGFAVFC